MNFTLKIKQELINKKMNKEEILSFVNGMLCTHILNLQDHDVKLRILNIEIFNFLLDCLEKLKWQYLVNKNTIFIPYKYFQRIKPKYANVYLAGIFLSSGSISNLNSSSYHLEISFKNPELWIEIMEFAKKNIQFNKIQNKKNFVLYLKKNELISDFLQIIGASNSYFSFIDSIIERDFKNQITRIFNLDIHNQNKLVNSNQIFLENLNFIKDNNLENKFTKEQLLFFQFKKQNPFLSLQQLSEEFFKKNNVDKTKSGLNHWLIKLRKICDEYNKKK